MKIRQVGAQLFHADGSLKGQIGMTNLIVAFRNLANRPKDLTLILRDYIRFSLALTYLSYSTNRPICCLSHWPGLVYPWRSTDHILRTTSIQFWKLCSSRRFAVGIWSLSWNCLEPSLFVPRTEEKYQRERERKCCGVC